MASIKSMFSFVPASPELFVGERGGTRVSVPAFRLSHKPTMAVLNRAAVEEFGFSGPFAAVEYDRDKRAIQLTVAAKAGKNTCPLKAMTIAGKPAGVRIPGLHSFIRRTWGAWDAPQTIASIQSPKRGQIIIQLPPKWVERGHHAPDAEEDAV